MESIEKEVGIMGKKGKRLAGLFFAVLLCMGGLAPLAVDGTAKIFQVSNDASNIYLYVNIPAAATAVKADIHLKNQADGSESTVTVSEEAVQRVSVAAPPQSYLFLIDAYTDKKAYVDGFTKAIDDLMTAAPAGSTFSAAAIVKDNKITSLSPFTADSAAIQSAVKSLEIESGGTSLYSGLMKAIELYGESERDSTEICNIVVISDGIESADSNSVERQELDKTITAFKKGRNHNSLFLIHTLQYKSSPNAKDFKDFAEISKGTFFDLASPTMAKELLSYVNDSYLIKLSRGALEWTQTPLTLQISMDLYDANGASVGSAGSFEFVLALADGSGGNVAVGTPGGGGGGGAPMQAQKTFPVIPVVIGACVLLLLAAGVFLFLRSKKTGTGRKSVPVSGGVFIKVEVVGGGGAGSTRDLTLTEEILIGRDAQKCGLLFQDSGVSSVHARLFLSDGAPCLEDANSLNGTAINHMPIHAPNKLRSGDLVTIGTSSFTLRF